MVYARRARNITNSCCRSFSGARTARRTALYSRRNWLFVPESMSRMRLTMEWAWLSRYKLSLISFSSSISGGPSGRPRSLRSPRSPRSPPPSRGGRPSRGGPPGPRLSRLGRCCCSCVIGLSFCHQSGPFQGHQPSGPQLHFRGFSSHQFVDQVRSQLLKFAIPRAAQDPVEAALETPRALHFGPGLPVGLMPVNAAQLIEELPRHAEIMDEPRDCVLELGGVVEMPPFQNPAE